MAFSVTLKNLGAFAAASNLQLFLRKTSDNSLLNAGGDTGSDPSSIGSFTWTVAEDRPAEQMLARIYEGSTETAASIIIDSVLNVGFTEIGEGAAVLDPATRVKLDASQPDYDLPTNTELNAAIAASQLVITTDTADIPRYGDLQRFDQSANNSGNKTADVTITKLS